MWGLHKPRKCPITPLGHKDLPGQKEGKGVKKGFARTKRRKGGQKIPKMCLRLLWTPGPLCPSLSAEKNESLDATVRWVSHSVYISIKPDILIFLSWKSDFSFFTSFASASSKDPVFTKTWLGIHTTWSRIWRKSREILWKYNYVTYLLNCKNLLGNRLAKCHVSQLEIK